MCDGFVVGGLPIYCFLLNNLSRLCDWHHSLFQ